MARPDLAAVARAGVIALALLAVAGGAAAESPEDAQGYGRVGYAKLDGVIDRLRRRYLERVLADADREGLDTLVVHIETDGGDVRHAREMFRLVLERKRDGPRMIAYVDDRAISAGALITYAHEAVYVSESASIGDIGVIFIDREGEMKYAPEKVETVIRTVLVQAAEQRGWDRALLLKMTARNQKLYRVKTPDGGHRFVIEDDLPDYRSRHPDLDLEDPAQIVVYRGEDRLLTLTGREAASLGMATGIASTLEALYAKLGVEPASVVDLGPRPAETTAWLLSTAAPILAGLTLLFLMFELKTPGVGLWALLGAGTATLFLLSQYYLDMAENFEIVLMLSGLALVVIEVFTVAGGGIIGIVGGLMAFAGLLLAFLPNELEFDLDDEVFLEALGDAVLSTLVAIGVLIAGLLAFIRMLPGSGLGRRIAVQASVEATSAGALQRAEASLAGRTGHALDMLHPGGTVVVDGTHYGARCEHGEFVEAGAEVEVVGAAFGELVVRAAADAQEIESDGT